MSLSIDFILPIADIKEPEMENLMKDLEDIGKVLATQSIQSDLYRHSDETAKIHCYFRSYYNTYKSFNVVNCYIFIDALYVKGVEETDIVQRFREQIEVDLLDFIQKYNSDLREIGKIDYDLFSTNDMDAIMAHAVYANVGKRVFEE